MPSIQFFIEVLLVVTLAYFLLHQVAANSFELATYRVLPFYNVPLVVREGVGAVIRWYHGLPTYAALDDAKKILKLTEATGDSVLVAYRRLEGDMLNRRWAYPDSQHEAVTYLAWEFNINLRLSENCEFFRNELNRATHATRLQEI